MYFDFAQHKQKGSILIFLLIGILAIAGIGGAYYFGYDHGFEKSTESSTLPAIDSQTPQPTASSVRQIDPNIYDQKSELSGFPIYPESVFVEKKYYPKCEEGTYSGFSNCDVVTYTYETKDDYDQVSDFYRMDKSQSGWICSGGAGSYDGPRGSSGRTSCKKNDKNYSLDIDSNAVKTSISINIPLADYKGEYFTPN